MKISASVILYNPPKSIYENLYSYLDYVDLLILIDNSPNSNFDILKNLQSKYPNKEFVYHYFNCNKGISVALNYACSVAIERQFGYLFTMDQDSSLISGKFFELVSPFLGNNEFGIIGANPGLKLPFKSEYSQDFFRAKIIITSGNIINLFAWRMVGGFNELLFIDEVDHEFCLRMDKKKFSILISKENFLSHQIGNVFNYRIPIINKNLIVSYHPANRTYYIFRNALYMISKYWYSYPRFTFNRIKFLCIRFSMIIILYPQKSEYLKFISSGISDFFHGRFGMRKVIP